jgi:hypothetical protein
MPDQGHIIEWVARSELVYEYAIRQARSTFELLRKGTVRECLPRVNEDDRSCVPQTRDKLRQLLVAVIVVVLPTEC